MRDRTVVDLMHDPERVESLSADGQQRLLAVRDVLEAALRSRGTMPFSRWIEATWMNLGGPACLEDPEDFETVDQFFGLLDAAAATGDIEDPAVLEKVFSRPLAQADPPRQAGIEIMTIHRAKGLEFDTVVLFGLAPVTARRPGQSAVLDGAVRSGRREHADPGADVPGIRPVDIVSSSAWTARKDDAERARLLYVATTRARDRLHLVCRLGSDQKNPQSRSLLGCVWGELGEEFEASEFQPPASAVEAPSVQPMLRRLKGDFPRLTEPGDGDAEDRAGLSPSRQAPSTRGPDWRPCIRASSCTAICAGSPETGLAAWDADMIDGLAEQIRLELVQLGVESAELDLASSRMSAQRSSESSRMPPARWILSAHTDAASELRLTVRGEARLEHLQLDRTFIDPDTGIRWIIDYKTSAHEGGDIEAFLDSEVLRYRAQLERYASAMAEIDPAPIRVGLYFPLIGVLRHWEAGTPRAC